MSCWQGIYTANRCCDLTHGATGLQDCWSGEFDYARCCTLTSQRGSAVLKDAARRHGSHNLFWCAPPCEDAEKGMDRVWEALRYHLFAAVTDRTIPDDQLIVSTWAAVASVFHGFPDADAEAECHIGSAALKLIFNAIQKGRRATAKVVHTARALLRSQELLWNSFCGGWPVFRILSLVLVNATQPEHRVLEARSRYFVDRSTPSPLAIRALMDALDKCETEYDVHECLSAAAELFKDIHAFQAAQIFGIGVCPPGSFAARLDRMEPAPPFPLCVRSSFNRIDDEIRRRGGWQDCQKLVDVVNAVGSPGCHVLDVGANIGACTLLFARLGYRVTAFEPLPSNANLLRASIRLNAVGTSAASGPNGSQDAETTGEVLFHQRALGDDSGVTRILEGRQNAGMSVPEPVAGQYRCDERAFLCEQEAEVVQVDRLDDVLGGDQNVCFAKIDAEGWEMKVLRGALSLLRGRTLRALMLEWWPPHLSAIGEEPISMLWLLHTLRYDVYAPAVWFTIGDDDGLWIVVAPSQFQFLLSHWGDILAIAAD